MVGSTVIQLVADDPDAGTNSEVRYSLVSQVVIPFEINEGTGTVLTTGTFNYDQGGQREFSMQVMVTLASHCDCLYVCLLHTHTLTHTHTHR